MLLLELDVEPADRVDDLQSRQHRPVGIVFVRDGVTEIRHESVAHVLGVVPFIVVDDLFRDAMKIGDGVTQVLGVHSASEDGGVHEIAAQAATFAVGSRACRGRCSRRPDRRSKRPRPCRAASPRRCRNCRRTWRREKLQFRIRRRWWRRGPCRSRRRIWRPSGSRFRTRNTAYWPRPGFGAVPERQGYETPASVTTSMPARLS